LLNLLVLVSSCLELFVVAQRSPVDLIEVEGELVAGYNVEISGANVLIIYFSEYFHLFNAGFTFVLSVLNLSGLQDALSICVDFTDMTEELCTWEVELCGGWAAGLRGVALRVWLWFGFGLEWLAEGLGFGAESMIDLGGVFLVLGLVCETPDVA
jgi:NADH:ubiquinone oxidoreductase subunit H